MYADRERPTPCGHDDAALLRRIVSRKRHMHQSRQVAQDLLVHFGGIARVFSAAPDELREVAGVCPAIVGEIRLLRQLSDALARAEMRKVPVLENPQAVFRFLRIQLGGERREKFHVLYLDRAMRLIADKCLQIGTVDHVTVYPREVLSQALRLGASSLILVHNHPSGSHQPSAGDITMTRHIEKAGIPLGIGVADHIIVGGEKNFSFKLYGLLQPDP